MSSLTTETRLMVEERSKIDFNVEELTNILDGGPDKTALRRKITSTIQNSPILGKESDGNIEYQKALELQKPHLDFDGSDIHRIFAIAIDQIIPLHLHRIAFVPPIRKFGSPEQVQKWLPLADKHYIVGAYGQTELGHGSNLRGLETTATYNLKTEEFIINTPKISSMKFWPGDMGKGANHVLIMANLLIKGKSYGMNSFIVQIRDLDTHMPLPGVKVGNIGETFSLDWLMNDHGYLILDHVRIPKANMLSRIAEIDSAGNYILKEDQKLLYGSMMLLRVRLVVTSGIIPLQKSCTIATRYSIVRRQGALKHGEPEIPVLDYVTQQHKLLPLVAECYAFHFASQRAVTLYEEMIAQVDTGDYTNLPELHALTAGMKAFISDRCLAGTDICRRACGGHGYLKASGFPAIYLSQLASVTYEGENTIMYLQCARYLIKCVTNSMNGKLASGIASYLNDAPKRKCSANSEIDMTQHEMLSQCLQHRASMLIREAKENLRELLRSGRSEQEAWNMTAVQLIKMTKAHLDYYVLSSFISFLENTRVSSSVGIKLREICVLFGLHVINENVGDLLKDGYLDEKQAVFSNDAELAILSRVRKYALGLVDAFDFTDKTLNTCIGTYDGNAYERLFESTKQSPRNKTEVHEGFYSLLRPYLHEGRDILEGRKSKL